jgi:hypothetical protein
MVEQLVAPDTPLNPCCLTTLSAEPSVLSNVCHTSPIFTSAVALTPQTTSHCALTRTKDPTMVKRLTRHNPKSTEETGIKLTPEPQ